MSADTSGAQRTQRRSTYNQETRATEVETNASLRRGAAGEDADRRTAFTDKDAARAAADALTADERAFAQLSGMTPVRYALMRKVKTADDFAAAERLCDAIEAEDQESSGA